MLFDRVIALLRDEKRKLEVGAYKPRAPTYERYLESAARWQAYDELEQQLRGLLNDQEKDE